MGSSERYVAIPFVHICRTDPFLRQADSYQTLRVLSGCKIIGSVIDLQDETEVSALRRGVGAAFATNNLLDYELDVDNTAERLVQAIRKAGTVVVFDVMQQFQVDFLVKAAFSKETDYLESRRPTRSISGHARLAHWTRYQSIPTIERLLFKSPICSAWWYRSRKKAPIWTTMAIEEYQKRIGKSCLEKADQKPDLLSKYLQGGERHKNIVSHEAVIRMISSTISAGFDTSAYTMTTIIYFLLRNPDTLRRLQLELDHAVTSGNLSDPPKFTEADRLKYLGAVIKESMRLSQFLPNLLERVVPSEGAEIAGKWLPGGTVVGVPAYIAHRDSNIFGNDANEFRPERWLEADGDQRILMERSVLGFGGGKRICIGRHIAELEMKKVIPRLLLEFNVSAPNVGDRVSKGMLADMVNPDDPGESTLYSRT